VVTAGGLSKQLILLILSVAASDVSPFVYGSVDVTIDAPGSNGRRNTGY
jgi:hypothetical protein